MPQTTLSVTELKHLRQSLRDFDFPEVMNLLGWNRATGTETLTVGEDTFKLRAIAQLGGVKVFEVTSTHTTAASSTKAKSAYVKIAMSDPKDCTDWLRSSSGVAALMPS